NNIVNAYGSGITPPAFEINKKIAYGKKFIAMYFPGEQPMLIIDEEVYDICISMKQDSLNALASLLGHELSHHFEKHSFCSDFAYILGEKSELGKKIKQISQQQKLHYESQADFYGGFYGYVAGYKTYDILPELLDKIYIHYKLPDQIKGYPTKEERKNIAKNSYEELKKWLVIFDAGELLITLKEYELAASCFDYLSTKFPGREIFNNAGVVRILHSLEYFDNKEFPFSLPVEFDAKTRLKKGAHREINLSVKQKRTDLLNKANECFKKSINRDPKYLNAQINHACAYILSG
ncbi:unnamed protein product, partial [marine sediment metagenome]